ncbi:hypothetical protein CEXT_224571 [Caerostris extrusa]|uniref:Uncharacterized protein n=1 Tax=Caerostris extrusa TaxID=172846 RepID=A0AAV4XX75_CAEEX|nr:hypothetical protein CEXT_224571 [Caerostris extrusa]
MPYPLGHEGSSSFRLYFLPIQNKKVIIFPLLFLFEFILGGVLKGGDCLKVKRGVRPHTRISKDSDGVVIATSSAFIMLSKKECVCLLKIPHSDKNELVPINH